MTPQTYKVNYDSITWTNEYEGWSGLYQSRTDTEIITLHFASNAPASELKHGAGNPFGADQRAVYQDTMSLPRKGEHEITFLRGTRKQLVNGEWVEEGLMRPSEVHADPLDNDPFYNIATVVEIDD